MRLVSTPMSYPSRLASNRVTIRSLLSKTAATTSTLSAGNSTCTWPWESVYTKPEFTVQFHLPVHQLAQVPALNLSSATSDGARMTPLLIPRAILSLAAWPRAYLTAKKTAALSAIMPGMSLSLRKYSRPAQTTMSTNTAMNALTLASGTETSATQVTCTARNPTHGEIPIDTDPRVLLAELSPTALSMEISNTA